MEGLAEKWVDRCVSRKPDPSIYKDYAGTAQVLIVSHKSQTTFTKTISAVKEEAQHYEYRDNTCTGECDFYKQIIWANLTEVGCAMKTCVTYVQRKVTPANVVVCVYKIAQRIDDMKPYEEGESCTKCPPQHRCVRNQCEEHLEQVESKNSAYTLPEF
ncbi:unnamed protein product [Mesocestoides corti]|uniref:SCP domain-containing protein n=1 Tax=Mesocestoides corti TaxID=53468 RepID=A0A0R3UNM0_MESCO|nr:unnamed protein product [Mesocestoides corti]